MKKETKIKETCPPESISVSDIVERINLSISNMLKWVYREVTYQFTVYRSQFTQFAFTLAETLIVIGVIGIVAALTLPNLNSSTGDKETITRVKKAYSTLVEAYDRMEAVYGPANEWWDKDVTTYSEVANKFGEKFTEFLKVTKNCKLDQTDCYGNSSTNYTFVLSDGSAVAISNRGMTPAIDITIDIDGHKKGKNQSGRDVFQFVVSLVGNERKGILPYYDSSRLKSEMSSHLFSNDNYRAGVLAGIAADWVLKYENLDYLKTDSTMKCNNNPSIILDGVTNTSCH